MKKEERFCKTCNKKKVEDEFHFFFHCSTLDSTRKAKFKPILDDNVETTIMNDHEKLSWLIEKDQIKEFSRVLVNLYQDRQGSNLEEARVTGCLGPHCGEL